MCLLFLFMSDDDMMMMLNQHMTTTHPLLFAPTQRYALACSLASSSFPCDTMLRYESMAFFRAPRLPLSSVSHTVSMCITIRQGEEVPVLVLSETLRLQRLEALGAQRQVLLLHHLVRVELLHCMEGLGLWVWG